MARSAKVGTRSKSRRKSEKKEKCSCLIWKMKQSALLKQRLPEKKIFRKSSAKTRTSRTLLKHLKKRISDKPIDYSSISDFHQTRWMNGRKDSVFSAPSRFS